MTYDIWQIKHYLWQVTRGIYTLIDKLTYTIIQLKEVRTYVYKSAYIYIGQ